MNLSDLDFNKKQEYSDGKYSVYSFSKGDKNFKKIVCDQESICIIPFDLNEHEQIKNIYLAKYKDHLTGEIEYTCISDTFNKNEHDSYFEAVERCLEDDFGLKNIDVNDTYFLGKIKHGVPFSKEYRCYAVNLNNYSQNPSGYVAAGLNPNPQIVSMEKVRFNRILKGDISDSLALSCAMLLLSYFSE